jgi:hypothetical protein
LAKGFDLMAKVLARIRKARWGAVCALILACATPSAFARRQDATTDSAAKKPATTKPATKKPAAKTTASTHQKKPASSSSSAKVRSTSTTHKASTKRTSRKKKSRARGQQKIDSERATAIQEALIREHYLSGEATGTWNQASEDAMRKYQADHGWQSKQVPDSRALIKLGLGPSKDHLLNPESAMTTGPDAPRAQAMPTTSQTSAPTASQTAPTADPPPAPVPADSPSPQ